MGLFYNIPFDKFIDKTDIVIHATNEAQKRINDSQLSYATLGGPGLFKYSDRGKELKEKGVEILQVAGCETTLEIELWVEIYNAYLKAHTRYYYLPFGNNEESLCDLLK